MKHLNLTFSRSKDTKGLADCYKLLGVHKKYNIAITDALKQEIRYARQKIRDINYDVVTITHKETGERSSKRVNTTVKDAISRAYFDMKFKVQWKRRERTLKFNTKHFMYKGYMFHHKKMGTVFCEPETFIKMKNYRRYHSINNTNRVPHTDDNYVGIEIEMISPINREDLSHIFIKHDLDSFVSFKDDNSIHPKDDETGIEINLLAKESEYKQKLDSVLKVLHQYKCRVDQSCGLHVHLDMRNRNPRKAFYKLVSFQRNLLKLVHPERSKSKFCKRNRGKDFDKESSGRYKVVNKQAYSDHRSLEVRLHHGSIDYVEITKWVDLLLHVINNVEVVPKKVSINVDKFLNTINLNDSDKEYWKQVERKFTNV